jgi:YfiH family protein
VTGSWIPADWSAPDSVIAGSTLRDSSFDDLELAGHPCWLNQVHGADVVIAREYETPPDADAAIGCSIDDICVVRSADCLPVLISSRDGTEIAAAHAGWRGLAAGIVEATVGGMRHDPDALLVWLGPAISQAAFEVGDEVRAAFVAQMPDDAEYFEANARGRWQADLYGLARRRLRALGVAEVTGGGFCTFTDRERFYSYRRNPDCGRLVSFVAIQGLEK